MYPHEYPGALWYDQEEVDAVSKVISNKSPFRYYGVKSNKEVFNFEKELGEYLSTSSLSNNNKYVLINNISYLNNFAANSLLKTLEENIDNCNFILVSSVNEHILDTIKSRCFTFKY